MVIRWHVLIALCCTVFACSISKATPEERTIRVTVKDHDGKPLKDVRIFPLEEKKTIQFGPGFAVSGFNNKEDKSKKYFATDAAGLAEVVVNKENRIALTHKTVHGWAVAVTEDDELSVTLPQPATVEINYDIEGNNEEGKLFYQWLSHEDENLKGVGIETTSKLKLGKTVLTLPPGPYQFCRQKTLRQKLMHRQLMIDRQRVVLKPGETHQVNFIRKRGAPISGSVVLPDDYEAILIYVKPQTDQDDKKKKSSYYFEGLTYDALRAGEYDKQNQMLGREGKFTTETLLPGTYVVEAHGHKAIPEDNTFRNRGIVADQIQKRVVEVPDVGNPKTITINFDPS